MALISLHSVSFSYSGPPLLQDVTFHLETGERVCVIGRNGAGKSSLLSLLAGDQVPQQGLIETSDGLRIGYLPQMVPDNLSGTVFEIVAAGLGATGDVLVELERSHSNDAPIGFDRMEALRRRLGEETEWELAHRVHRIIRHCRLEPEAGTASMSAGMKRRVLLARALVANPDVLLLDEPTNHLDIPTIQWLEDFLVDSGKTLVFITHDRMLAGRLATRIVEIDRGQLHNWACDYPTYLLRRDGLLSVEDRQKNRLDRKLRQEEAWLHRGIKARRTRNEGRVNALKVLRAERKAWRELTGSVRMQIQEATRSGRLVIEAEHIGFAYDVKPVIRDFSTSILRGDRIGIMGPNGCGKSTLLRLLLGELEPLSGSIRFGTKLEVAYFDQLRQKLDPEISVIDSIAGGLREVTVGAGKKHVISYLKDFLFDPTQAEAPVKTLSGGERNRLLLARLFTTPSNFLILDEPTNDLDSDTLEILENQLMDYAGTVLVVSHDRSFLNNVVTATLVFEEDGVIREYAGGYDDWLLQRNPDQRTASERTATERTVVKGTLPGRSTPKLPADGNGSPARQAKLSYHLVRELAALPEQIDAIETEIRELYEAMSAPDYYLSDPESIRLMQEKLRDAEQLLESRMTRWAELDDLAAGSGDRLGS